MTTPNDPRHDDFRGTLPADLQGLDAELSGIRIEERPSFGPELERELLGAWRARKKGPAPRRWVRLLAAAGVAGLMIAGVSVDSARAAVGGLLEALAHVITPEEAPPETVLPEIHVEEPADPEPEPATDMVVSPADVSEDMETSEPDFPTLPRVVITFPEIVSRQEAARIIASHYPKDLQEQGIEGRVKLQFWVSEQGIPENIQIRVSTGNHGLDRAAMLAMREIRFRPATRNGVGVGTWVEVGVHFYALTGAGIIGSDSMETRN